MSYLLPALSFPPQSLEPHIDALTMQIHHDKHHQTYVDKLNTALENHADLALLSIENLLKQTASLPEDVKTAVRNHGGGHSNHSIFWTLLTPEKLTPSDTLKALIEKAFGTWDSFIEKFTATATGQFGSGWAWLTKSATGALEIKGYPNQDSPYMDGLTPIFGIDVWEHAYYLKYQNRRPEYIAAFFNVVNWKEVEKRLSL